MNCQELDDMIQNCPTSSQEPAIAILLDVVRELNRQLQSVRTVVLNGMDVKPPYSLPVIAPITTPLARTEDAENDRLYDQWNKKERHD